MCPLSLRDRLEGGSGNNSASRRSPYWPGQPPPAPGQSPGVGELGFVRLGLGLHVTSQHAASSDAAAAVGVHLVGLLAASFPPRAH